MAYEKKTWETGEVITADGLNHMEEGIEENGKIMIVRQVMPDPYTNRIDKDFNEVKAAIRSNQCVLFLGTDSDIPFTIKEDYSNNTLVSFSVSVNITDGSFYQIRKKTINSDGSVN